MKKMFILTISIIVILSAAFIIFYEDTDSLNVKFLSSYGVAVIHKPSYFEETVIPEEFDEMYESYNMMQLEAGLDLYPYRGKNAVRYTYEVVNFPQKTAETVYANVICVRGRPVAGDISCPALDGFTEPLNLLQTLENR